MNAQVTEFNTKEVSLSLTNSDIGTLYIVQHELLKNPSISFAGVILKHPLTKEYWVRIASSKGNPHKEIIKAIDLGIQNTDELKKLLNSKIKRN